MSFWLNDNGFVVCLRQVSFAHKILLSTSSLMFFILGWVYFYYLPTIKKITKLKPEIADLRNQTQNLKTVVKSLENGKELNNKLNVELKSLDQLMFNFGQISDFLLETMLRHKISCSEISPQLTKQNHGFIKDYLRVDLKGRYCDFINFCKEIKQQKSPLIFCYIKLIRWKDAKIKAEVIFRNVYLDDA